MGSWVNALRVADELDKVAAQLAAGPDGRRAAAAEYFTKVSNTLREISDLLLKRRSPAFALHKLQFQADQLPKVCSGVLNEEALNRLRSDLVLHWPSGDLVDPMHEDRRDEFATLYAAASLRFNDLAKKMSSLGCVQG